MIWVSDSQYEAILSLKDEEHTIIHSDRGHTIVSQDGLRELNESVLLVQCRKRDVLQVIQRAKLFFRRLKNEMFYGHSWKNITIEQFIDKVNEYIIREDAP